MSIDQRNYYYRAFGLYIVSEIYFPDLLIGEEKICDVHITYGEVPDILNDVIWTYSGAQLSKNELLLKIENVASYHVVRGNRITVQPEIHADDNSIKQYILGTCLGTILLQRGLLPLHGSCVMINGAGIILSGICGAGKSTLSAALHKEGFPFLSDDISVVSQDIEGNIWVQPGLLHQKLTNESANVLGVDTGPLHYTDIDKDKYLLPVKSGFLDMPVKLSVLCELLPEECTDVTLTPINGIEKLNTIIRNIYRSEFLNEIGMDPKFFKGCFSISKKVTIYQLRRPQNRFTIEDQIQLLKNLV